MELFAEGITLRPWTISDAQQLAHIANNKKIAENLRDGFPFPYSISDARVWLNMIIPENQPPKFFAILAENDIAGSIAVVPQTDIYRKNLEVGYFLSEDQWGKGIMTKSIKAITTYAFNNFDVVRLYAEPFADNTGSRKALEKAGYRLEATLRRNVIKNGIVKDSCIYSVLREEWPL